jgi:hypothetical protein
MLDFDQIGRLTTSTLLTKMTDLYTLSLGFANISKIVLCIILKVPQIIHLVNSKSTTGLSLPGTLLELTT